MGEEHTSRKAPSRGEEGRAQPRRQRTPRLYWLSVELASGFSSDQDRPGPPVRGGLGHLAALRALKGASRRRLLVALHDLDCRAARPYPPSPRNEIPDRQRLSAAHDTIALNRPHLTGCA